MTVYHTVQRGASLPEKRGLSLINKVEPGSYPKFLNGGPVNGGQLARAVAAQADRERWSGRPARRAALSGVRVRAQPARRYAATVSNGAQMLVIDSAVARVYRAKRRVSSWASVVPAGVSEVKYGKNIIQVPRLVMVTLTYRDIAGWAANDIREYMQSVRRVLGKRLLAYSWVMEVQSRGAPHYHVMLYVRRGTHIPSPDSSGMWGHGSSRIETARTPYYIVKYVGKEYQKELLPKGARMFAVWIDKKLLSEDAKLNFALSAVPSWLREVIVSCVQAGADIRPGGWSRAPGGGWLIRATGEIVASPWLLVGVEPVYEAHIQH